MLIVLCMIVAVGSAVAVSQAQESVYKATAVINYRSAAFYQRILEIGPPATSAGVVKTATNADEINTQRINEVITGRLGLAQADVDKIEVTPQAGTDLLDVEATATDPNQAAALANSYAAKYVAVRRGLDRTNARDLIVAVRGLRDDLKDLEPSSREKAKEKLDNVERQLELLSRADTGNEFVKTRASAPQTPAEPRIVSTAALAAVAGLLIGLAFAVWLHGSQAQSRPRPTSSRIRE